MSLRLVIAAVVFVLQATPALGAPAPAASCQAAKLKATGKAVGGLLGCHAKAAKAGLTPSPTCIARAQQAITGGFAKAEARGGCSSEGDAGAVGEAVSGSVVTIVAALRPALAASTCVSKKLGAAGKYGAAVLTAHAANVTRPSNANLAKALAKASSKLDQEFAKASQGADCSTSADVTPVRDAVDDLVTGVFSSLAAFAPMAFAGETVTIPGGVNAVLLDGRLQVASNAELSGHLVVAYGITGLAIIGIRSTYRVADGVAAMGYGLTGWSGSSRVAWRKGLAARRC